MSYSIHPPSWEPVNIPILTKFRVSSDSGPFDPKNVISRQRMDNQDNADILEKQPDSMPTKFNVQPTEVKSEPTTPICATGSVPEEAPNSWFFPVTHKEKLAILTMEQIPGIMNAKDREQNATSPTQYFSPTLVTYLERMKFHFARAMALGRYESENGRWDMQAAEESKDKEKVSDQVYPRDVMSSLEIQAFMAGIEEVRHPAKDDQVLFRRYWRILAPPGSVVNKVGGIVSTRATDAHPSKPTLDEDIQKHWNETPRQLLAEYIVGRDGESFTGRWITVDEEEEEDAEEFAAKKPAKKAKKKGRKLWRK